MAVNGVNGSQAIFPSITKIGINDENNSQSITQSFGDYLRSALNQLDALEKESAKIAEDFAAGKTDNIHGVMIAGQKAEIALQFTMQIRNKILDAYNEIMRMQI